MLHIILHMRCAWFDCIPCVKFDFNPRGVQFNTLSTMSKHIVDKMLPGQHGEVHRISLHEGVVLYIF